MKPNSVLRPDARVRCDRCRNFDGARCRAHPPHVGKDNRAFWPLVAADDWCASFFLDLGKRPELVAAERETTRAIEEIAARPLDFGTDARENRLSGSGPIQPLPFIGPLDGR